VLKFYFLKHFFSPLNTFNGKGKNPDPDPQHYRTFRINMDSDTDLDVETFSVVKIVNLKIINKFLFSHFHIFKYIEVHLKELFN
jgi:hypothetical protein